MALQSFQQYQVKLNAVNKEIKNETEGWSKDDFWDATNCWYNKEQDSNLHLMQVLASYYQQHVEKRASEFGRDIDGLLSTKEKNLLIIGRKEFIKYHFDRLSEGRRCANCNFDSYYKSYLKSDQRFGSVIFTEDLEKILTIVPKIIPPGKTKRTEGDKYSFPNGKINNIYPQECLLRIPRIFTNTDDSRGKKIEEGYIKTEEVTGIKKSQITSQLILRKTQIQHITVDNCWNEITLIVFVVKRGSHDTLKPVVTDIERQEVDAASWMNVSDLTSGQPLHRSTDFDEDIEMSLAVLVTSAWPELQKVVTNYKIKHHVTDRILLLPDMNGHNHQQQSSDDSLESTKTTTQSIKKVQSHVYTGMSANPPPRLQYAEQRWPWERGTEDEYDPRIKIISSISNISIRDRREEIENSSSMRSVGGSYSSANIQDSSRRPMFSGSNQPPPRQLYSEHRWPWDKNVENNSKTLASNSESIVSTGNNGKSK